jgi:glyoxylase-like metal-dependent hydrolase (beta-lactamase superfamily II)
MRAQIGDVTVTSVLEVELATSPRFLFEGATYEMIKAQRWLYPQFVDADDKCLLRIQLFMIETQGLRIAVDTCVGNDKEREAGWHRWNYPFLERFSAAGFDPAAVDLVVSTHLHVDHVGWNTRLVDGKWIPTFPNARYLFVRPEVEHWRASMDANDRAIMDDSVEPIFTAGLADVVESGHRINHEVSLESTPGHTPGHQAVRIVSDGVEAVITGDLMHHPIQCAHPDLGSSFDVEPALALATRRAFMAQQVARNSLVLGTHFTTNAPGRFVPDGDVWRFVEPDPVS